MSAPYEVPSSKIFQYKPKQSKYAVVIHVINEGEKIQKQILKMQDVAKHFDVILADGGSTDGSLDDSFLTKNNITAKLIKTGPGKLSAQMRMSFAYCLEADYDGVIVIDGNNKDNPSQISFFSDKLDAGYDHVQGSRFMKGGLHANTPLLRYLAIRLIHAPLISIAAGFKYTDSTNGFRGYSRNLLTHPKLQIFRNVFSLYELHYYLAIRAAKLGLKVIEVPVERRYPKYGKIPTKISGFRGYILILSILFKSITGQYNPKDI